MSLTPTLCPTCGKTLLMPCTWPRTCRNNPANTDAFWPKSKLSAFEDYPGELDDRLRGNGGWGENGGS